MAVFGFIPEKDRDMQRLKMLKFGVPAENIVSDPTVAADSGDVLVIPDMDSLGSDLCSVLTTLRQRRVHVLFLDSLLAVSADDNFRSEIFWCSLSTKEVQLQLQSEGIAAAKAAGVRFGRQPKKRPKNFEYFAEEYLAGRVSSRCAGKALGISHTTFIRWIEQQNQGLSNDSE